MSNFDGFYGSDNFSGSNNKQVIVEKEVVCHTEQVEIVQQRLAILHEIAKKIVTEQICEVEVQTIVIEQFRSSLSSFSNDVARKSGRQVGFDSQISGKVGQLVDSNGNLTNNDLGFNGSSIGNSTIVPSGNNFNPATSPASIANATAAATAAAVVSGVNASVLAN